MNHEWTHKRRDWFGDQTCEDVYECGVCGQRKGVQHDGWRGESKIPNLEGCPGHPGEKMGTYRNVCHDVNLACAMLESFCEARGYTDEERENFFDQVWGYSERATGKTREQMRSWRGGIK